MANMPNPKFANKNRNSAAYAASAFLFALAAAALIVFPESSAQPILDYIENDPRYATEQPCQALGGQLKSVQSQNDICSDIDTSGTFCIVGSQDAFPCAGLYKRVVKCNREYNRVAINPFVCGEICPNDENQYARGKECVVVLPENAVQTQNITLAASIVVAQPAMTENIPQNEVDSLYAEIMSTMDLTFQNTQMEAVSLTVGNILIIPESKKFREPIFRVITTIEQSGENVIVQSRQAALAEIIPDGVIVATAEMVSPQIGFAQGRGQGTNCRKSGVFNKSVNINLGSGQLGTCAGFDARMTMTISFKSGRLQNADFRITGSGDFFANLAGNLQGQVQHDFIKWPGRVILQFGVLPSPLPLPLIRKGIPIYIYANSNIGINANLSVNLSAKYSTQSAAFGVNYDRNRGNLEAINDIPQEWRISSVTVSVQGGSAQITSQLIRFDIVPLLGPVAKKLLDDRIDIGLQATPVAANLKFEATNKPESEDICWNLTAGLSAEAKLQLKVWDNAEIHIPPWTHSYKTTVLAKSEQECLCTTPIGTAPQCNTLLNAAFFNDVNCAQSLIAGENLIDNFELHRAARENSCQVAQLLIQNDADVNLKSPGHYPLFDTRFAFGVTPLHIAAGANATETAALLLENGADVNAKGINGDTPLHWAARENLTEIAALLLENGADVNAKNANGWTPLYTAARENATETAALLLENGADVNAKDLDGDMPLHMAARANGTETAALLLENGAEVNAKGKAGRTPLHYTAYGQATETAALLLENGAEVNAKDNHGNTPLYHAAGNNGTETAALLLENGADVNAKDNRGRMPLHSAAIQNATETAALLLENGADVNAKDNRGRTPLGWAINKEHSEMQSLLRAHGGCRFEC